MRFATYGAALVTALVVVWLMVLARRELVGDASRRSIRWGLVGAFASLVTMGVVVILQVVAS